MNLHELMADVAVAMSLEHLDPDEQGTYRLQLDGQIDVRISQLDAGKLMLQAVVGQASADEFACQTFLHEALQRCLWNLRDCHDVIAMEPGSNAISLFRTAELVSLTSASFCELLESFANVAEFWMAALQETAFPSSSFDSSIPGGAAMPSRYAIHP